MIKANELRIGNWFRHNNTFCKEEMQFEYEFIKLGELVGDEFPQFDPIPLTPKILEKAGFMRDEKNGHYYDNDFQPIYHIMLGVYGVEGMPLYFKMKSLHQLQNLYFALTGKELNISL